MRFIFNVALGLVLCITAASAQPAARPSTYLSTGSGFVALAAPSQSDARIAIDAPVGRVTAPFAVGGWAIDLGAPRNSGIDAVHVYAYPTSSAGGAPIFLGASPLGFGRPDIGALYGDQFASSGWIMGVASLPPGPYLLIAYAHSTVTNAFSASATTTMEIDSRPLLSIDSPAAGEVVSVGTRVFVGGWAIDLGSGGPGVDAVHVWIYPNGGADTPFFAGVANYGVSRPDVGAAFGPGFVRSGYELDVNGLARGDYVIAVFAHSTISNSFVVMQTRAVTIQ